MSEDRYTVTATFEHTTALGDVDERIEVTIERTDNPLTLPNALALTLDAAIRTVVKDPHFAEAFAAMGETVEDRS